MKAATVVFLGDYCDRGPDTRGVLEWLVALYAQREAARAGSTILLAGNHDLGMAACGWKKMQRAWVPTL